MIDLEIDFGNSMKNKITINMYDKELMPLVDDLYFTDQTVGIKTLKSEGVQEGDSYSRIHKVFEDFAFEIEDEVFKSMSEQNVVEGVKQEEEKNEWGDDEKMSMFEDMIDRYEAG